ncbi:SDR family NAD(P)-dependent oxidoreductase [uncultured Psychromonas sp.]|uniref:SDR family NAD(P)-dependent oxidoreductase n=1 Tax=uncultured Psychromonas sp. TaxID=173974 RepID=UPI0026324F7A|nr:SDR family NAD(P)-dependent oxidoreductase [uncultured Psychromonas sp.]
MKLEGKHVVITGATAGIGQASAISLAKSGARITIVARNQQKIENTLATLKAATGRDDHRFVLADFSCLASVRRAAEEILSWDDKIDVLQNNAGIASSVYRETSDGYEELFAVNHLAGFLLTGLLLPLLNEGARIINVSAMIYASVKGINFDDLPATKNFDPLKGYAYSKLANILFTKELAERLKPHGVTCNVLHPGAVSTTLGAEDKGRVLTIASFLIKYFPIFFKTPEQGAATSNYLSESDDIANVTGKYFVNCKQVPLKPVGEDMEAAKRLWALSEKMTGFTYPEI